MSRKTIDNIQNFIFVVPALLLIAIFIAYPFITSVYYSFTDWDGISSANIVGIKNYIDLFSDSVFLHALKNTLFFTVMCATIIVPFSMLLAVILNSAVKGRALLRTIFYLPAVISMVVISNLWNILLAYDGIFNGVLRTVGLGGLANEWLGNYDRAPWVLAFIIIWQGLGHAAVFFLAGLQSIPVELYEAGEIDGVGSVSKFRYITFPLLMPTFTVVLFLQLSGLLKLFDIPFIMTNGGPGDATKTMAMQIYIQAFKNCTAGYATTTGIILLLIAIIVSVLQIRITGSKEVEL